MTADEGDSHGPSVARPRLSPAVIYLIGVPAVGKHTIAKEIGRLTGARVVDNQLVNLPVFHVLGYDGRDTFPFPKGAWEQIGEDPERSPEGDRGLLLPNRQFRLYECTSGRRRGR